MSNATKWYVRITKHGHHRADKNGAVKRAVLVLEDKLGRLLEPFEEAHHINGEITDDRPENLEVTTHSEHAKIHGFSEYNHNPRNTKGRPFYGNKYVKI
jgi:GMP synthase-like glutamine amidotransferase